MIVFNFWWFDLKYYATWLKFQKIVESRRCSLQQVTRELTQDVIAYVGYMLIVSLKLCFSEGTSDSYFAAQMSYYLTGFPSLILKRLT